MSEPSDRSPDPGARPPVPEKIFLLDTSIPARYRFLILSVLLLATATQVVRIATVRSSTGEMPFLSANDRSRWCTILALVANGTYSIDDVLEIRDPETNRRTWHTIDRVQHREPEGSQRFYSSKPPLLSTLYAGVYWVFRGVTGATLTAQPFLVVRGMLILVNLLPLVFLWYLMLQWAYRYGLKPWQLLLMSIFVTFGTFLSTFSITLNNHLPAAVAAAISLACLQQILISRDTRARWFVGCGLATSFVAVNELPALAWVVFVAALLMWWDFRRTVVAYLPALLPAVFAFFGTNYLAHGTLRPPYAMRDLGALITTIDLVDLIEDGSSSGMPQNEIDLQTIDLQTIDLQTIDVQALVEHLGRHGWELSPQTVVRPSRRPEVWQLWDESTQWRFGLQLDASGDSLKVHQWGDWYDYPDTYWTAERKQGVDRGEPSRIRYAFHCFIGHHGIFSLTPFWLLSLVGAWTIHASCRSCGGPSGRTVYWQEGQWWVAAAITVTTVVVLGFYLMRPMEDRNYGGVTSGLRWTFWMIPLWYWLAIRGLRHTRGYLAVGLLVVALVISVYSATIPWGNPWTSPWLTQWFPL